MALCASLLMGMAGCGDATGSAPVESVVSTTATARKSASDSQLVSEILPQVMEIRGLKTTGEIDASVITSDELRRYLEEEAAEEADAGEIDKAQKMLRLLGLIEADDDLMVELLKILSSDIAGYYDQETRELRIVDDNGLGAIDEITLAHEVTHALQDQNYSLNTFLPADGSGNDDLDLARKALVEGDASLVELQYFQNIMDRDRQEEAIDESSEMVSSYGGPPYIEATLTFPYEDGLEFVSYLKEEGGWQAVNDAYAHPPESTEQIIHPWKYLSGERPVEVRIPALPELESGDWQMIEENVAGEFDLAQLLDSMEVDNSSRAAAGWGGNRYRYYEHGDGRQVLVMLTAWDSEKDAEEFSEALNEGLAAGYSQESGDRAGSSIYRADGGFWLVEQRQGFVSMVIAPDESMALALSGALLGG